MMRMLTRRSARFRLESWYHHRCRPKRLVFDCEALSTAVPGSKWIELLTGCWRWV